MNILIWTVRKSVGHETNDRAKVSNRRDLYATTLSSCRLEPTLQPEVRAAEKRIQNDESHFQRQNEQIMPPRQSSLNYAKQNSYFHAVKL